MKTAIKYIALWLAVAGIGGAIAFAPIANAPARRRSQSELEGSRKDLGRSVVRAGSNHDQSHLPRTGSSERHDDRPHTKPVDRPTRGPVLTRRPCQWAHRSQISRL